MNRTELESKVSLRKVQSDDLSIFYDQQQNRTANQLAAVPAREREDFWAHWQKNMADESVIMRAILSGDQVAGNVVSWNDEGQRKLGYWLGQEFWGKGIGSTAVSQYLQEVQERPLYADVAKHNIASIRILQKCGFVVIEEESGGYGPGEEEVAMFVMRLGE